LSSINIQRSTEDLPYRIQDIIESRAASILALVC
jgi:hypothetical protein